MRASRLVSLLLLLQLRGRRTAQELADELEVSVRTIYRDAEALLQAGVPITATAGRDGGYELLHGFRIRLTGLTAAEAEAMVLAGLPRAAAQLGLGAELAAAQLKVQAELPPELRDRWVRLRERFHLDAAGWYRDAEDPPLLGAVADAVLRQRRLRVTYRRWREPEVVEACLHPHGLVLKAGTWYLVAAAEDRPGPRTYRVDQVLHAELLDGPGLRPADFDLAAWWTDHVRGLAERLRQGTAEVRLSPRGRELLAAAPGTTTAVGGPGSFHREADGSWRTTIAIESEDHAVATLLALGAEVEVLSPPELRARMRDTARALAARYDTP